MLSNKTIDVYDSEQLVKEFQFLASFLNGTLSISRKEFLIKQLSQAPALKVVNEIPLVIAVPIDHTNIESQISEATKIQAINRLSKQKVTPRDETDIPNEAYIVLGVTEVPLNHQRTASSVFTQTKNNNRIPLRFDAVVGYLRKKPDVLESKKLCALGSQFAGNGTPVISMRNSPQKHIVIDFMIDESAAQRDAPDGTYVGLSAQRIIF